MDNMIEILAQELHVRPDHAQAVANLLDEGNTVPFIVRYRKEQHGPVPPLPAQAENPGKRGQGKRAGTLG